MKKKWLGIAGLILLPILNFYLLESYTRSKDQCVPTPSLVQHNSQKQVCLAIFGHFLSVNSVCKRVLFL